MVFLFFIKTIFLFEKDHKAQKMRFIGFIYEFFFLETPHLPYSFSFTCALRMSFFRNFMSFFRFSSDGGTGRTKQYRFKSTEKAFTDI